MTVYYYLLSSKFVSVCWYLIVKENTSNKSIKLEEWKNFCMWNDKDNKIVFEWEINIPNNEIWVINLLGWIFF